MSRLSWLAIFVAILSLSACGSSSSSSQVGGQPSGDELEKSSEQIQLSDEELAEYQQVFIDKGCEACHSIHDSTSDLPGPPMVGLVSRIADLLGTQDYTGNAKKAEAYIRESIVEPSIYIVPNYMPLMPFYEEDLSKEEVDKLVAYLLTFK